MRILALLLIFSVMLIAMFIYLDQGGAKRDQILSKDQKEQLKDAMKPPRL